MFSVETDLRNFRTIDESLFEHQAMQHVCLNADSSTNSYSLPKQSCDRMRAETFFPSCWDGVNLDSDNHSSHVSYTPVLSHPQFFNL